VRVNQTEVIGLIVLGVIVVALVVGFVVSGSRRRSGTSAPTTPRTPPAASPGGSGERSSVAAPPTPGTTEVPSAVPDIAPAEPEALPAAPAAEEPEPVGGRLARLRGRLARSGSPFGARLLAVLSRDQIGEDDWDEIEEALLLADVGAGPSAEIVERLRTHARVNGLKDAAAVRANLRAALVEMLDPSLDRTLHIDPQIAPDGGPAPAVVLVVGVNGTGKTTTVGKLTRVLVAEDKDVLLGAADTFRAAAADQLSTWGARVGVETVRSEREGGDPASVAFDAVRRGRAEQVDVVLVDTAGRLQNKADLMDELGKIARVIAKEAPLSEVLLVLDATTGQNGLNQARVFAEVANVTGIVLTKLDGTARGGIVIAVQRELGVPVKLVGLGEGPDDLAPFDVEQFVDGILAEG